MTKTTTITDGLMIRQFAILLLASSIAFPTIAQQTQLTQATQSTPTSDAQQNYAPPSAKDTQPPKEGFWGHMNPFARKTWVKKRLAPLNDQLSELDEVNSKNTKDILDVDRRAKAGISRAQSTADAANQAASLAGNKAQQANSTALNANNHVDSLNNTVSNLDNYTQKAEFDLPFRGGKPDLSSGVKSQLDDLANKLNGQPGYILELEAHSPAAGNVGIQNSKKLADAVERYLVVQHDIPVYRMHTVALGNVQIATNDASDKPAHPKFVYTSSVHVRLMENSLATQASAVPPAGAASLTDSARP